MEETQLFASARSRAIAAYEAAKQPFTATTRPYKSTAALAFACYRSGVIIEPSPGLPSGEVCYAVAPAQEVEWFTYGIGDPRPVAPASVLQLAGLGGGLSILGTDADTTLSKPRQTNGSEDFIIEGLSASHSGSKVGTSGNTGDGTSSELSGPPSALQNIVKTTLEGFGYFADGFGVVFSPEAAGPSLEDLLYQALAPHVSIELEWVRQRKMPIGTLEQFPEGAGKSRLRAMGDANTANRFRVPEGLVWRRQGQQDSELIVRGKVSTPVVVPFVARTVGVDPVTISTCPRVVILDVALRAHGLVLDLPSVNF